MDPDQLIRFYEYQLEKFKKIGIGNKTEHNTEVSQKMIDTNEKRLKELIDRKEKRATKTI